MLFHSIAASQVALAAKSRLFKIAVYLVTAICSFALLFWIAERPYHSEEYSYIDAIESILIFTLSGFDVDSPNTLWGWSFALISLLLGILFVGAFTAEIASIFVESRMKQHSARKSTYFRKHILLCGHLSDAEYFFEQLFHPDHGNVNLKVVLLMSAPPNPIIEGLISSTKYKYKVHYIIGSPLIYQDLAKANAAHANAAFVFPDRFAMDPDKEDAKTILRTLAIKHFNSKIITYVQVLKSKNKGHIRSTGADNVLCIDELSLNIIAQSCINPGLTDLISNLVNSSDDDISPSQPLWLQEHFIGNGREIYRVPAGLFSYGKPFSEVASVIFDKFEITLIALHKLDENEQYNLAVNPGKDWIVEPADYLFVIADSFDDAIKISQQADELPQPKINLPDMSSVIEKKKSSWRGSALTIEQAILDQVLFNEHIIICGAGDNLPLLISPLRSPDLLIHKKIVILDDKSLKENTWKALSQFNEIYFVRGSFLNYKDLERVNIANASKILILNNRKEHKVDDETMIDANTVMTVMGTRFLNKSIYVIAEIIYSSNIQFIRDKEDNRNNHTEKKCFGANEVVTISRIADSIVCQSFYTDHFMAIFEELFSVDVHDENEERNTCEIYQITIPTFYHNRTYGELFHFLCYENDIIPVGLYRTKENKAGYTFTSPPKEVILNPSDKVYIFAAEEPYF